MRLHGVRLGYVEDVRACLRVSLDSAQVFVNLPPKLN